MLSPHGLPACRGQQHSGCPVSPPPLAGDVLHFFTGTALKPCVAKAAHVFLEGILRSSTAGLPKVALGMPISTHQLEHLPWPASSRHCLWILPISRVPWGSKKHLPWVVTGDSAGARVTHLATEETKINYCFREGQTALLCHPLIYRNCWAGKNSPMIVNMATRGSSEIPRMLQGCMEMDQYRYLKFNY